MLFLCAEDGPDPEQWQREEVEDGDGEDGEDGDEEPVTVDGDVTSVPGTMPSDALSGLGLAPASGNVLR